jgi:hypothetical protein
MSAIRTAQKRGHSCARVVRNLRVRRGMPIGLTRAHALAACSLLAALLAGSRDVRAQAPGAKHPDAAEAGAANADELQRLRSRVTALERQIGQPRNDARSELLQELDRQLAALREELARQRASQTATTRRTTRTTSIRSGAIRPATSGSTFSPNTTSTGTTALRRSSSVRRLGFTRPFEHPFPSTGAPPTGGPRDTCHP